METCWEPSTGTDSTRYLCSSSNKKPSLSQGGLIAGPVQEIVQPRFSIRASASGPLRQFVRGRDYVGVTIGR